MINKYVFSKPAFTILLFLSVSITAQVSTQEKKAAPKQSQQSILFVGNSFTFGYGSPVRYYRSQTVNDLNGIRTGGVPALFKVFANEAGENCEVSVEAAPGRNLDYHYNNKAEVIGKSWDRVVLQGYSTLDKNKPGDPTLLIQDAKKIVELLKSKNPKVDIRLESTWSRADQTYEETGFWFGKPIEKMALDLRKGYNKVMSECAPEINGVIPVGEAWNRAIKDHIADPNPYDGISAGQIDLWAYDNYHASAFGYYLNALVIFGSLTGLDPRSLGKEELAAVELGFSQEQTSELQRIAYEELTASDPKTVLHPFNPVISNPDKEQGVTY